jgi:hypothetical protein
MEDCFKRLEFVELCAPARPFETAMNFDVLLRLLEITVNIYLLIDF